MVLVSLILIFDDLNENTEKEMLRFKILLYFKYNKIDNKNYDVLSINDI